MNLRQRASLDLQSIVEGDGWPVVISDPFEVSAEVQAQISDIGETLDPETGQLIAGQSASALISLRALASVEMDTPVGVTDAAKKPWVLSFTDLCGTERHYKVTESRIDRTIGAVLCILQAYRP